MSERYSNLFRVQKNLYAEGAPVIIVAGALLLDNETGAVLAQLKFQSVCQEKILALKAEITCFDTAGRTLGDPAVHQYLDLNTAIGEDFGAKVPIYLPDTSARSFSARVTEATFADGTIWSDNGNLWEPLAEQHRLNLGDPELDKQYRIQYGHQCNFAFERQKDLWHCPCGAINKEGVCYKCLLKRSEFDNFNVDVLKTSCDARLEQERATAKRHKKIITPIICVGVILALIFSAVGICNHIKETAYKKNQLEYAVAFSVMPNAEIFKTIDISSFVLPATVTEVYKESRGGYVVKLTTSGYSTGLVIVCGVDAQGAVTGATCLASSETLGAEKTYGEKTVGKTLRNIDGVDTIASATKTTAAYKNAVKDALNTAVILGGGSVDLRDEAQILKDQLSAVLPAAEGAFSPWFMVEELEGVTAVYLADNGAGVVFQKGEEFVLDDALAQKVKDSKIEAVDISGYELNASITKVEKTASGNYVFEMKGSGFGINGDEFYAPSGEPIMIRISVTPAGKIIACETISQQETDGIGSACAEPAFYTQFNGKDESNYKEIDAISGATLTTNGYKAAVGKVFASVTILEKST